MKRRAFLAGVGGLLAAPARAETISGATAIAGDRFKLGDQEFHLADILAPSAYRLGADGAAFFEQSRAMLAQLLNGADLRLADAAGKTRWGARVVVASRVGEETAPLQTLLAEAGAARVAPQTDGLALIDALLAAEDKARAARRGLWALKEYRPFNAQNAGRAVGAYHLVEGAVMRAARTRSRFYLNFGEDYKTDFTAGARNALYRMWAAGGFDMVALEGVRLRVRGFVENINGPSIDLKHNRQIEILNA